MKTSTERILTTHVGSIPRPDTVRELLRARLDGRAVKADELAARVDDAVADVVRQQVEAGIDVVSDGEMSKTSFIAYTDERLAGFTPCGRMNPTSRHPNRTGPGRGGP